MPLAALVTNFGGVLLAGILQADGGATTMLATLTIKLGYEFPSRLLADGSAD